MADGAYEDRSVWGPRMWAELHASSTPGFLAGFVERIPCQPCRASFEAVVAAMQPYDRMSVFAWRVWTWDAHNVVNRQMGRPAFSFEAAAARWGWDLPPYWTLHREGSD